MGNGCIFLPKCPAVVQFEQGLLLTKGVWVFPKLADQGRDNLLTSGYLPEMQVVKSFAALHTIWCSGTRDWQFNRSITCQFS